ncbi:MAG: hypothetical protein JWN71_4067, partial [Xanthobacteraceae bacterium]|nr:hypothetical protein [Xanthobacteraceae bacterium]
MNPGNQTDSMKKKVLISNAIWGKDYCAIFTRYSLASLLAEGNIPKLATLATITFHIVTTKRDRRLLVKDPAILKLKRYCQIEWNLVDDFGILRPPVGEGGAKYS